MIYCWILNEKISCGQMKREKYWDKEKVINSLSLIGLIILFASIILAYFEFVFIPNDWNRFGFGINLSR